MSAFAPIVNVALDLLHSDYMGWGWTTRGTGNCFRHRSGIYLGVRLRSGDVVHICEFQPGPVESWLLKQALARCIAKQALSHHSDLLLRAAEEDYEG